jgi:2,5-dihydroxypyridine 5,6-dioxygenase
MLGACVSRLDLPPVNGDKSLSRDSLAYLGTTPLTGNRAAIAALKASDLVLDLMTLLFSPEQHEILKAGTKILLAVEPPEVLLRMVPSEATTELACWPVRRCSSGRKEMRVAPRPAPTCAARWASIRSRRVRFVDQPGRWDHWPSGFAFTWPNEGQTQGTIVLAKGDILLPMKSYVTEPITLTVREGLRDADRRRRRCGAALSEYIESFNDPEAYAHLAHRLGPAAARLLVHAGPVRPRSHAGHGRARGQRQLPVLARPEQRGRRQPHHGLPHRHSHAPLQRVRRRPAGGREGRVVEELMKLDGAPMSEPATRLSTSARASAIPWA